jgi:hypothetical protein
MESEMERNNRKMHGITVFKVPALNWLPIEHSSAQNEKHISPRNYRAKMAHIKLGGHYSPLTDLRHLAD